MIEIIETIDVAGGPQDQCDPDFCRCQRCLEEWAAADPGDWDEHAPHPELL